MHTHMHACTHTHRYTCTQIRMHAHTQIHTHTHKHTHTHTQIHTQRYTHTPFLIFVTSSVSDIHLLTEKCLDVSLTDNHTHCHARLTAAVPESS